jgi:hypothetical protein
VRFILATIFGMLVLIQAPTAEAARGKFGTDEELRFIQETKVMQGPVALWLARKIRTENFMLPYMMVDEGYVLADHSKQYYPLDEAKIKELQDQGLLPNPLPLFKLELLDYILGYSLWLTIAVIGLWMGISAWWKKRKPADVETI